MNDDERRSMQLGIDPKNCVVVEDAAAGVQAARLAGELMPNPILSASTHADDDSSEDSSPNARHPVHTPCPLRRCLYIGISLLQRWPCITSLEAQQFTLLPGGFRLRARCTGMRVIGVTTTLAQEKMLSEGPDAIRPDIGHISVDDLMHLNRAHAKAADRAENVQQERIQSSKEASTSGNVSSG